MTRRKVFTVAGQGLGAAAGAAIALPAIGFALAPLFKQIPETWEGVAQRTTSTPRPIAPW